MPEAKASANEQSCKKFLCCPSKLSFWINISATFFTVPASKSRVSWVQGCFSALDLNLSQGSLRRLQCTGLLFCLPLLASAWFWLDPRVLRRSPRADYHMGPGNANPIYSAIFPDNGLSFATTGYFVWTKGANGYPWDVKTFDQNFVYDRSTELTWTDPQTFKKLDRKSTRLNSSHQIISYAVFCLKKKKRTKI